MMRGTTPTHTFECDVDLSDAEIIFITYKQSTGHGSENTLEKTIEDITVNGETLVVKLTQKETLLLSSVADVRIQIRAGFADGSRIASNIIRAPVDEILKDGEI